MKIWAFLIVCFLAFGLYYWMGEVPSSDRLATANDAYRRGIYADTIYDRERELNEALSIYSAVESESVLDLSNGRFYHMMGDLMQELHADAAALLYYYRAEKLQPNDQVVRDQINRLREGLGLPKEERVKAFDRLFFIHRLIPLPLRLQLLFASGIAALLLWSAVVWLKQGRAGAIIMTGFLALLLVSVLYQRYAEPLEGVLVEAALLTREPDSPDDWVTEEPTPKGMRVKVLDISEGGKWLEIALPDGTVGFVLDAQIRLI